MNFPKALTSLVGFGTRWFPNRIHRKLDDKDNLLAEALGALESRSATDYPELTDAPAATLAPSLAGAPATDLAINGVNFIGDATKASGASSNSTGRLDLEAVLPGEQTIAVTITNTAAALAITADAAAGTIAIVHGSGGAGAGGASTVAEMVAAIDADAVAKFMVEATEGVAGDVDADESFAVDGGTGSLLTLSVGGYPIDGSTPGNGITIVTDTAITFDMDISDIDGAATALVVGDTYSIGLRVDGVKVEMPFMVPAT